MAVSKIKTWWLAKSLYWKLVSVGVSLGALAAICFSIQLNSGRFGPAYIPWIVFNLVVFEIPAMAFLGFVVSVAVWLAFRPATRAKSKFLPVVVAGLVAALMAGLLIFVLFTVFPLPYGPWVAASVAAPVSGIAYAIFAYFYVYKRPVHGYHRPL